VVRNPAYVATFLAALVLPQAAALVAQLHSGYRPFGHAPVRVPLSWDMFATAISRCDVRWQPPIDVGGRLVSSIQQTGQPLEWDPVYDRVEDYVVAARMGCTHAPPHAVATLQCFTSDGRTVRDAFLCH
jgi:hypothetical protein